MAEKKHKHELRLEEKNSAEDRRDELDDLNRRHEAKRIRRVAPIGMRVVVRIRPDANVSDGGLYLPEGAKQATQESLIAEVLEVASAIDSHTDEETNVSGIPLGATVLIAKGAGVRVPWDEHLRIADT